MCVYRHLTFAFLQVSESFAAVPDDEERVEDNKL